MEKTTLYLPIGLQRTLREVARRSGRSQATLIREALERYLAGQDRPRPASIGVASDGTLDAADSEAWLRAQWGRQPDSSATPPKVDRATSPANSRPAGRRGRQSAGRS